MELIGLFIVFMVVSLVAGFYMGYGTAQKVVSADSASAFLLICEKYGLNPGEVSQFVLENKDKIHSITNDRLSKPRE